MTQIVDEEEVVQIPVDAQTAGFLGLALKGAKLIGKQAFKRRKSIGKLASNMMSTKDDDEEQAATGGRRRRRRRRKSRKARKSRSRSRSRSRCKYGRKKTSRKGCKSKPGPKTRKSRK